MRHSISVLVENQFGVLARIAGLFSGRGFNINSLSVGETTDPDVSRMTIVVEGDERTLEQVMKQLNKLINVIRVVDLTKESHVSREMLLIKVTANKDDRAEVLNITDIFRGKIVDVGPETYTIEVTGDEGKVDAFVDLLKPFGIREIARTGRVCMSRGSKSIKA